MKNQRDPRSVLNAIESLSERETPLRENINNQGPGGRAYDLAPNPRIETETQSKSGPSTAEKLLRINDRLGDAFINQSKGSKKKFDFGRQAVVVASFIGAILVGRWIAGRPELGSFFQKRPGR